MAMEINRQHWAACRTREAFAWRRRIVVIAAGWLLISFSPAISYAGHFDLDDSNPSGNNQRGNGAEQDHRNRPAAVASPASPNSAPMRAQSVNGKTTAASSATTTSTSASSILPPVPATALIQVPPVPGDPFAPVPAPAMGAMPASPAASAPLVPPGQAAQPADVEFGATQSYQVSCVLPGGSYCVFSNAFPVAAGSKCHCGQTAGSTE